MTTKASFNAEDWAVITTAPALAGLLVASAEAGGNLRESVALSRGYAEARTRQPGELLESVLSTAPTLNSATRPKTPEDIRSAALEQLRRAVRILDRTAHDDELVEYKRFVYTLAEGVAAAHKEGSFLGIGGKPVSEREQQALDAIADIFDEPVPVED
ncbi:hypothetical protein DSM104299_01586 [Baekduia alba]|uniref:hypothetical protein n=1 Tax=Baekduia alba TaxID=2997333 RepID=UPI00234161DD|nr:hypothetical protein [Baekduia alba]WCB92886.1 hypothetical protein DSM104299_01586 [Baekduia alba]